MVIHDLRNPTLSLKNGNDLAFCRFQNVENYKSHQKEMDMQLLKLKKQRSISKNMEKMFLSKMSNQEYIE